MTSHSWKCVTCSQSYRTKKAPSRTPKCPTCGNLLVPDTRAVPSPQPHSARTRASAAATVAAGGRPSARPAGPEEAIALSASSAWVPDPDPAPSPATPGVHGTLTHDRLAAHRLPPDPVVPAQSPASPRPIRLYATIGGVALAAVVTLVIILTRPSTPAKASANPPAPAPAAAAAAVSSVPAPAPVASATTITSEPPVVAPLTRTVNLLKLVDPATDTLTGNWRLTTGEFAPQLTSDATQHARLNIPYQPPQEYDFRVDFTRTGGDNCMTQIFTHNNPACLVLYGWKSTVSGFQQIANRNADQNPTGVKDLPTANGQRHTSIVKVRKTSLEAWLDGNLIIHYDTNGHDLGAKDWKIDAPLGVGTQLSPTTFHTIELTEITGHGKPLR